MILSFSLNYILFYFLKFLNWNRITSPLPFLLQAPSQLTFVKCLPCPPPSSWYPHFLEFLYICYIPGHIHMHACVHAQFVYVYVQRYINRICWNKAKMKASNQTKKSDSLSPNDSLSPTASQYRPGSGDYLLLQFVGLIWSCFGLVKATTGTVTSWLQQSCHVQESAFRTPHHSLDLIYVQHPFLQCSLSLGSDGANVNVPLRAEHCAQSLFLSTLTSCTSLHYCYSLPKGIFLTKIESSPDLWEQT